MELEKQRQIASRVQTTNTLSTKKFSSPHIAPSLRGIAVLPFGIGLYIYGCVDAGIPCDDGGLAFAGVCADGDCAELLYACCAERR
jgi:hypothetical protein